MGAGLLQVIRRVGIFIVCAQTIVHFKPNGSYEKYLKLLVSIMVMVQLVTPILRLLGGGEDIDFSGAVGQYEKVLYEGREQINITNVMAEEMVENQTMEEINSRLNILKEETQRQETEMQRQEMAEQQQAEQQQEGQQPEGQQSLTDVNGIDTVEINVTWKN